MGCNCSKSPYFAWELPDDYVIHGILGSGSFGQVWSCTKKSTNQLLAVKIMRKTSGGTGCREAGNNVDFGLMFHNEVSILATLEHPNIIRLHEFYEGKNYFYAILDRCEGGELFAEILKKRRLCESEAALVCYEMLKAIQYIHSCGIVHRDVKAENFLFLNRSDNSPLVLIDFGMSIRLTGDHFLKQLCGSPHYVAPELIRRNYRFKVDMWALGVVVFLMLYGEYPFESNEQRTIVQAILNTQPEYGRSARPPSHLAIDFMSSLLQKNPDLRLGPEQALQHPWILHYREARPALSIQSGVPACDAESEALARNTGVISTTPSPKVLHVLDSRRYSRKGAEKHAYEEATQNDQKPKKMYFRIGETNAQNNLTPEATRKRSIHTRAYHSTTGDQAGDSQNLETATSIAQNDPSDALHTVVSAGYGHDDEDYKLSYSVAEDGAAAYQTDDAADCESSNVPAVQRSSSYIYYYSSGESGDYTRNDAYEDAQPYELEGGDGYGATEAMKEDDYYDGEHQHVPTVTADVEQQTGDDGYPSQRRKGHSSKHKSRYSDRHYRQP